MSTIVRFICILKSLRILKKTQKWLHQAHEFPTEEILGPLYSTQEVSNVSWRSVLWIYSRIQKYVSDMSILFNFYLSNIYKTLPTFGRYLYCSRKSPSGNICLFFIIPIPWALKKVLYFLYGSEIRFTYWNGCPRIRRRPLHAWILNPKEKM